MDEARKTIMNFSQFELDERLIKEEHLIHSKKLDDVIVVFYSSTDTVLLYDSSDLSDFEKDRLVESLIAKVQIGTNYTREIIKKCGNVYFVY